MSFKLYEEENIRAIANKIREKTGGSTKYTTETMPAGVDAVYNAGKDAGGGSGGGSGKDAVLIAKRITGNGSYSAADDGADGYSRVDVNVPASGSAELPALNPPTLALDNYTATLTITDPDNGNYPEEYLIYYGTEYVGSSAEKTVNLLSMTDFKANDYVEVIAAAPKFMDSPVAAIPWVQPRLKSPKIQIDNMASILTIAEYDVENTLGFKVYVDGELLVTTSDTIIYLFEYMTAPSVAKPVTVVATAKTSYHLDSTAAKENWVVITEGTEGLAYSIDAAAGYATCTGIGTATETDIIIASWYEGYPVKAVGRYVASSPFGNNLTSVVIPEGVETINYRAFFNNERLKSVRIPSTLRTISEGAFEYAEIENVYISDLLAWCNMYWVYKNNSSMDPPISFNNANLYLNNKLVTDLVIPDGVTVIKPYRFYKIKSITSVRIPEGVTEIGDLAFSRCTNLVTVNIPKTVTNIHEDSFTGSWIFSGCSSLRDVIFGASVRVIPRNTFNGCKALKRFALSKTVEITRTSSADDAFTNVSQALTDVYYEGTAEEYAALTWVSLPIRSGCTFHYNVDLDNFTFPEITE